jgi:hypothetical protein
MQQSHIYTEKNGTSLKSFHEVMLKNCTVDYNFVAPTSLQFDGQFRLDANYFSTKLVENIYYIRSQAFITIHNRNSHRKRTKTRKN